jgi:NDP-sugar pyrophosphorylase family protein
METLCPIHLNSMVNADRLSLKPTDTPHQLEILDTQTGNRLGLVQQQPGSEHQVELFFGKGGFMGMITSPHGARYFALPGSTVTLPNLSLSLQGCAIVSNPQKQAKEKKNGKGIRQTRTTQATILGAGLATRFERISGDSTQYSKPAVPLAGSQSVIECIANGLAAHGFTHLIVNTYFKPESLKASLARCQGVKLDYIDENQPSGTAGGLRKMLLEPQWAPLLDTSLPLLVVQGDAVTDADFSSLMEAHFQQDALVTLGCQEVAAKDVSSFGIIVTDGRGRDGQSGSITGFQEKPTPEEAKSRLGNTGFYIFSPKAYPLVREIYGQLLEKTRQEALAAGQPEPEEVPFDFAINVFPEILRRTQANPSLGLFWAQTTEGYWSDIGNPIQYLESIHDLYAGKVDIPLPENSTRFYNNGIVYWKGAVDIAEKEKATLSGNVVVAMPFGLES